MTMFTMIWRLALGGLMTALLTRKTALLVERGAVELLGPIDTSLIFIAALVVVGAIGLLTTLMWAGLILRDAEKAPR